MAIRPRPESRRLTAADCLLFSSFMGLEFGHEQIKVDD